MRRNEPAFHGEEGSPEDLDRRLTRALEAPPEFAIPSDFAARVVSRVPASVMAQRQTTPASNVGGRVAWVALAILLLLILVLAPSAAGPGARRWLECAFGVEFVALAAWLSLRPLLGW